MDIQDEEDIIILYSLCDISTGLSLEDAIAFWRAEFTRKMDPDKVAYN